MPRLDNYLSFGVLKTDKLTDPLLSHLCCSPYPYFLRVYVPVMSETKELTFADVQSHSGKKVRSSRFLRSKTRADWMSWVDRISSLLCMIKFTMLQNSWMSTRTCRPALSKRVGYLCAYGCRRACPFCCVCVCVLVRRLADIL